MPVEARQRQVEALADFDVVLLQEARRTDLGLVAASFDWCEHSLPASTHPRVLGTAVLGRNGTRPVARWQMQREQFTGDGMYADLGRWYFERHLAVDVLTPGSGLVRMMSAHATPGSSRGPGEQDVGARKRWFHTHMARAVATWDGPFLFAVDANSPAAESLDWSGNRWWMASQDWGGAGEDLLLGPEGVRLHVGRDLWRDWLSSPAGADDLAKVPAEGPLARSHLTGGNWYRYDHLYGSPSVKVVHMEYRYDAEVSDHALVAAILEVAPPDTV